MQTIHKIGLVFILILCSLQTLCAQKDEAEIYLQQGNICWNKVDIKCAEENYRLYIMYYKDCPLCVDKNVRERYKLLTSKNDDKKYLLSIFKEVMSQKKTIEELTIYIQEVGKKS